MFYYIVTLLVGMFLGACLLMLLVKFAPKKWFEDIIDEEDY